LPKSILRGPLKTWLVGEIYGWIDRGLRCITLLQEAA
jgi:hypothetical protein